MVHGFFSRLRDVAVKGNNFQRRLGDKLAEKVQQFLKVAVNPAIYWVIWRVPQDVDFVQNDVQNEIQRFTDYRAHLRLSTQAAATPQLPKVRSTPLIAENNPNKFLLPSDTRPGLLGIPDLDSHLKFEELSKIVVGEARRLLLDPETFSSPKRAVQVIELGILENEFDLIH